MILLRIANQSINLTHESFRYFILEHDSIIFHFGLAPDESTNYQVFENADAARLSYNKLCEYIRRHAYDEKELRLIDLDKL